MSINRLDPLRVHYQQRLNALIEKPLIQMHRTVDNQAERIWLNAKQLIDSIDSDTAIYKLTPLLATVLLIIGTALLVFGGKHESLSIMNEPFTDPLDALSAFLLPKASIWPLFYLNLATGARKRAHYERTLTIRIDVLYRDLVDGSVQLRFPEHHMSQVVRGSLLLHGWTITFQKLPNRTKVPVLAQRRHSVRTLRELDPKLVKAISMKTKDGGILTIALSTLKTSSLHGDDLLASQFIHTGFPSHTLMDVLAYCESNNLEILSIWNVSQSYATEQHAMARRLSKEYESAKSTIVMKHWEAGLHQADILERFAITLKYFCNGK